MVKLRVHKIHPDAILPHYAHDDDAGFDLFSTEDVVIPSLAESVAELIAMLATDNFEERDFNGVNSAYDYLQVPYSLVRTGLTFEIPEGYEIQIRSKSGLAAKSGIFVLNAPATIDEGYRGELMACLCNLSNEEYFIKKGQKIAQGVIAPVTRAIIIDMGMGRGTGGFGSTGLNKEVVSPAPFKNSQEYIKDVVLESLPEGALTQEQIKKFQSMALQVETGEVVLPTEEQLQQTKQQLTEAEEDAVPKTKPYKQEKPIFDMDLDGRTGLKISQSD